MRFPYDKSVARRTVPLAAQVFGVPLVVLMGLLGSVFLLADGGWLSGPHDAFVALAELFGFYLLLVAVSSILAGVFALAMPKRPRGAAYLAITALTVVVIVFGAT